MPILQMISYVIDYHISCLVDSRYLLLPWINIVEFLCVLVFLVCVTELKNMYYVKVTLVYDDWIRIIYACCDGFFASEFAFVFVLNVNSVPLFISLFLLGAG